MYFVGVEIKWGGWRLLAGSSLLLSCIACTKDSVETLDPGFFGYDYFPLTLDAVRTYRVDSVIYIQRAGIQKDTTHAFIREVVRDSFRDALQQLVYRVERFHTRDSALGWTLVDASYVTASPERLTVRDHGLTFIRLVFPVQQARVWDGNVWVHPKTQIDISGETLEPYENWYYLYEYAGKPDTLAGRAYSKVCKVSEADDENIIQKRYSAAWYAAGIGLVYREQWLLDTQNTDASLPFHLRAQKGFIMMQTLIYP